MKKQTVAQYTEEIAKIMLIYMYVLFA